MKVIHVHSDKKFIISTRVFIEESFENTLMVLGESKIDIRLNVKNVYFYKHPTLHLSRIIKLCTQADAVVLYGLDSLKIKIALGIPEETKILWRFFGAELYSLIPDVCFSEKTKEANRLIRNKSSIKSSIQSLYKGLKAGFSSKNNAVDLLSMGIKRSDFFLGLCFEEYQFLKSIWQDLPTFVQLPYIKNPQGQHEVSKKPGKPVILLGNNKSAYNNHLEIIDIVRQSENQGKYDFKMLFNYGNEDHYAQTVRFNASQVSSIDIVESFMPREEFVNLYNQISAFVLNGHRQMAVGNITLALENGVKIYLNTKNVYYHWLVKENFIIYTIEDFVNDLKTDNLIPDTEVTKHNLLQRDIFTKKYSQAATHRKIFALI